MVCLINSESPFFNWQEAQELYEKNKEAIEENRDFAEVVTPFFFSVFDKGEFAGCIFCYELDGKNWIGGFAKRKKHRQVMAAINLIKVNFEELYARTKRPAARICLKKAGFEKIDNTIWIWRKEYKK